MNSNGYISEEMSKTITDKWVFSIAPNIYPPDDGSPYSILNQKKTNMQFRLANVGGERVEFNLSWPQFDAFKHAVDKAQENAIMEKSKKVAPFFWSLADSCGDDNLTRIFGEPDEKGLCPVRSLVLMRQPIMKDGTVARLPWYLEISRGKGVKEKSKTGGFYVKSGSYQQVLRCNARLSDGSMKNHAFWGEYFMDALASSFKGNIVKGYKDLEKQKEAFRIASHNK